MTFKLVHCSAFACVRVLLMWGLCCWSSFFCDVVSAQNYPYERFTIENGLKSNTVYCVHTDTRGYLWIGTDKGVQRYNGKEWLNFNVSNDPRENEVFEIFDDKEGNIVFSSIHGNHYYAVNDSIIPFSQNKMLRKHSGSRLEIKGLVADAKMRSVRLASHVSGVVELAEGKDTLLYPRQSEPAMIELDGDIFFMNGQPNQLREPDNTVSIQTRFFSGVFECKSPPYARYVSTLNTDSMIFLAANKELVMLSSKGLISNTFDRRILCLKASSSHLVLGFYNGGLTFLSDDRLDEGFGFLADRTVTGFAEDYQDGIWVSTLENGLYHVKTLDIKVYYHDKPSSQRIISLDSYDNEISATTLFGIHMTLDDKGRFRSRSLYPEDRGVNDALMHQGEYLVLDRPDRALVNLTGPSTAPFTDPYGNHLRSSDGKLISFSKSKISVVADSGRYYSSTLVYDFSSAEQSSSGTIEDCFFRNDTLYFIAANSLYRLEAGNPVEVLKESKDITFIRVEEFNEMCVLATAYDGLRFLEDSTLVPFTEEEGLSSNSVLAVAFDPNGDIWVATESGLDLVSHTSRQVIRHWSSSSGFSSSKINAIVADASKVYLGTMNGMTVINKATKRPNTARLVGYTVNGVGLESGSRITLDHGESATVDLSCIDYNSRERAVRYRIADTENWVESSQTSFAMANLPWGMNTLEFSIRLDQGIWSTPYSILMQVNRPWWARPLFLFFSALLVVICVRLLLAAQKKRITVRLRQKNLNYYYSQQLLRSKMDPHFIFNGLNSALYFIETGTQEEASEYVTRFSQLMRNNLAYSQDDFISLSNELSFIKSYIDLEVMRLEMELEFNCVVSDDVSPVDTFIPSMVVQPLVENGLWHGLSQVMMPKMLEVNVTRTDTRVMIKVIDNGVGMKNSAKDDRRRDKREHASDFIKKRFSLYTQMYGVPFIITYADFQADRDRPGTLCVVDIPYFNQRKLKKL